MAYLKTLFSNHKTELSLIGLIVFLGVSPEV